MSKHTPGPWHYDEGRGEIYTYNIDGHHDVLAHEIARDDDGDLLAKSPDMYDLIMKLSRCVVYGEGGTIEVRDWDGLEDVLQVGNAIYQEVEGI